MQNEQFTKNFGPATCKWCGKNFLKKYSNQEYCTQACSKEFYKAKYSGEMNRTIVDIAVEARKKGMSYGQLQAMKYSKEH